jgi:UDP-N-acetyl-D-mannosaminuronic acid transferase (WecB/TagA/CpsF family)
MRFDPMEKQPFRTVQILGVDFAGGPIEEVVSAVVAHGGLLVVPAAPALVNIKYDAAYREALVHADFAIADSGAMVLLWKILRGLPPPRISGLRYLSELLSRESLRQPGNALFVLPSDAARDKTLHWLRSEGFLTGEEDCYVAPRYTNPVEDPVLLDRLNQRQPANIIVAIGGGVQEKLGYFVRERCAYTPAIHCIGAALGFLTGDQRPIPNWADKMYLGWLLRLARNPRLYARRFWLAHELPWLIWRYGSDLPPQRPH